MTTSFDSLFDQIDSSSKNQQGTSSFDTLFDEVKQKKKSPIKKVGRIAGQLGLGLAESALLPYEIAAAPLASKKAQTAAYRENLGEDIERLLEQRSTGVWDEQDEDLLKNLVEQMRNPEKSEEFVKTADIGVRGLAEKATGMDLHPEGVLEKAASWAGFIKDPKKIASLANVKYPVKDIIKAIAPTGKESMRGLGAGTALQMAEDGEFGPIGTMAAAVVGDIAGHGVSGLGKALAKPKKSLATLASKLTPKEKIDLQKELVKDFREAGLEADLGTLTDSDVVRGVQARLSQSSLTGKSLGDLKKRITEQVTEEYKKLADALGEARFATNHEAGDLVKNTMKSIRESDLSEARNLYKNATELLRDNSFVNTNKIFDRINNLEKSLKPGSLKSAEQRTVLEAIDTLKRDITDSSGTPMFADVRDLINNKIALNDMINYEVQEGSKKLLKGIVADLDRAIISHGKDNASFAKNYINANKKFSSHAKMFRTNEMHRLLKPETDPSSVLNKMNSVQGIRNIGNVLNKTPEGKKLFNDVKRYKLDQMIGNNLVDSTSKQLKLGTFSKLLEKSKNREIAQEVLGSQNLKKLEKLQKNSGRLAETANKFFNASKSGVVVADMAVAGKAFMDLFNLLSGNPWPFLKTATGISGARYLSHLMGDSQFLKLVEEAILANEKGDVNSLMRIGEQLVDPIKAAMSQAQVQD